MTAPPDISLLLPTRGRPQMLQRLFDSIVATTDARDLLEIVLYIDDDDTPSQRVESSGLRLLKLIRPAKETMGRMNQACYEASSGRYVMLMNDDVVFRTTDWDSRMRESFARFPDEIALVYGNDLHQGRALPTMPILSRQFCDLLGGVCPLGYQNTYIDLHLFDIFKKLAKLGYSRLVYQDNVIFEHLHHETGNSVMDTTYVKKDEQADDRLFINLEDERWKQANLLKRRIETTQDNVAPTPSKRSIGRVLKSVFSSDKSGGN